MGALERVFRGRRGGQERPLAAIVAGLWRNGEQGVWYDPSDLSTMYQDAAGTTPVYMPGSGQVDPSVGRILDKSGRGNHATQATTTSRPTLSGRYNLFINTEDASAWTKTQGDTGTSPVVTPDAAVAPNGTLSADRCVMSRGSGTTSAAYSLIFQSASHSVATVSLRSVWMRSFTGANQTVLLYDGSQTIGRVVTVTPAWQQFFLTGGTADAGSSLVIGTRGGDPGTYYASGGDPNLDILIWGMDLRAASDGVGLPTYQRVVNAATYDPNGFPLYLRFDGIDDFLQTGSIDFSGTDKVLVCTAVRKSSDAAGGILVELSATVGSYPGSFYLSVPESADSTQRFRSRGSLTASTTVSTGAVSAPSSMLLSGVADISAPYKGIRQNGVLKGTSSEDQGTGAFGNYPLYIGRRAGTSYPFNGRLYGLIIRGTATPTATLAKVERYLNGKAKAY